MQNIDKILGSENAMSSIADAISYLLVLVNENREENVEVELNQKPNTSTSFHMHLLPIEGTEEIVHR
jgi:hypothetical protein